MTPAHRFMEKVEQTPECWYWVGALADNGYGNFWDGARQEKAHRWSYVNIGGGTIPEGMVIDHICRVRDCVRPDHLRVMTRGDNVRIGEKANRTHCPLGHVYNDENTYYRSTGSRVCRACARIKDRARYPRRAKA